MDFLRCAGVVASIATLLLGCDSEPSWDVHKSDMEDQSSHRFVCRNSDHGLKFCAAYGQSWSDRENRCLLYFQLSTKQNPNSQPEIVFHVQGQQEVSAALYDRSTKAYWSWPLELAMPVENAELDDSHGQLQSMTPTALTWFYTGIGKGQTRRDIEALYKLIKSAHAVIYVPVEHKEYPMRVEISLDGFEDVWRSNLQPACDWTDRP